mgnify:CR=1 FL=1
MNKISIVGIGPGDKDYLLPIALKEIEGADCLIGAKRALGEFAYLKKKNIPLEGNFNQAIAYIKKNKTNEKAAILVSGDPGLYSFLGNISRVSKKQDYTVIPGISTLQLAFARLGESWQDVKIISLHGRAKGNLSKAVMLEEKVFLFTAPKFPPEKIARYLLNKGIANRRAVVFENLSYPDERIVDTDLKSLRRMKGFALCAMLIKKEK